MNKGNSSKITIALVTAIAGGMLFELLHTPIPWLLGPMIAVLIGSNLLKDRYEWPGLFRNTGMVIVGYTIGLSLTAAALREMSRQLPTMLLMTVLLLALCAGIAYLVCKLSGIDYQTALLACIPGGLTQVIALAEETKGVNITIVTVTQVIRLMMIVLCIPVIIFSSVIGQTHTADSGPLSAESASWSGVFPDVLLFAAVSVICAVAGNKIKFPTAVLLGPAIGTALIQLTGLHGPALPSLLINAAQLLIGTYVGLLLRPSQLPRMMRTLSLAIGGGGLLLAGTCLLSYLLTWLQPVSISTGLLSLAPGGMDQMGIIAHEINADLSMVAGYQLFRTFFIFFAVPPLIRLLFRYSAKKRITEKVETNN
ncbi:AbrB family transcriptional regulator [Paenibacillus nasutitermitis]|uniref:Aminopeptidase n=1 Tax=Paenibacillus nasutitermitis TaxID=1652958 RepID=A0A916ZAQ6_9BACL|nr:AbrB family transcriptional regulator [Paenibacillus nasutitermitis]GGD84763.1 aminopeptidase [Paenibacillus nasutitermitis]